MTLKEIEKIIDESNFFWVKVGDEKYVIPLNTQSDKDFQKSNFVRFIEKRKYVFFKINDNGEVEKRVVVDHIDKEKKIVKKKLEEMSDEEIDNLFKKNCKYNSRGCENCPLIIQIKDGLISCIYGFMEAKRTYDSFKDREFEVEVEE